jgi:exopolysaccharide biosynthesis predicted pyruvyltransferase EpsI
VIDILGRHVPRSGPVALLDFPTHFNVGDAAIWLGELHALREGGWEIAYACSHDEYDPDRVRERIGPHGTVLLHGGGNFGDLYPAHQELRLRVLSDLPDHRVVQLPQTLRFRTEEAIERAAESIAAHPDFVLLARDRDSERLAIERLRCHAAVCPDSAFALGPLERPRPPVTPVLALARRDIESGLAGPPAATRGVEVADWSRPEPLAARVLRAVSTRAGRRVAGHPRAFRVVAPLTWRAYERVARTLLRSGVARISRAEAVVTDRLHGHILCLLLGIPHVLIRDRFGKLDSFQSTWRTNAPIYDPGSLEDAVDRARSLAG